MLYVMPYATCTGCALEGQVPLRDDGSAGLQWGRRAYGKVGLQYGRGREANRENGGGGGEWRAYNPRRARLRLVRILQTSALFLTTTLRSAGYSREHCTPSLDLLACCPISQFLLLA